MFVQDQHPLLVIPGPVEVSDEVLAANAHSSTSHVSPAFAPVFANCIRKLREILYTSSAQPFIIAGSGTLGWDLAAANLIEPQEKALVLNTGYFGDAIADCLQVYGAQVTHLRAPVGSRPSLEEIEAALKQTKYKMLTFTHVDTSTGVLSDAKAIGQLVKRISPDTLVILDGVCSVASEEIRVDDWNIDVVVGAPQKGITCPPGLSLTVVSQRALEVRKNRKAPIGAYFADYARWLPIMQSYEAGTPGYFATPPVNLIYALEVALKRITESSPNLQERFQLHKDAAKQFRAAATALGYKTVAVKEEFCANGMTALYTPEGVTPPAVIGELSKRKVVIAGGLHKDIKTKYIRAGHMGESVTRPERDDLQRLIKGLQEAHAAVTGSASAGH